jgi:hypothetical protein
MTVQYNSEISSCPLSYSCFKKCQQKGRKIKKVQPRRLLHLLENNVILTGLSIKVNCADWKRKIVKDKPTSLRTLLSSNGGKTMGIACYILPIWIARYINQCYACKASIYAPLSNKYTKNSMQWNFLKILDISLYQWDDELIKLQQIIQKTK